MKERNTENAFFNSLRVDRRREAGLRLFQGVLGKRMENTEINLSIRET